VKPRLIETTSTSLNVHATPKRVLINHQKSGFGLKNQIRFLGDLPHSLLEHPPIFFHPVFVGILGNEQGLSPEIDNFAKGEGEDEIVPAPEHLFPGGAISYGKKRSASLAGKLHHTLLDDMFGALGAIRSDRQVRSVAVESDHTPQAREARAGGGAANGIDPQVFHSPGDELPVPVLADQHAHSSSPAGEERHHEEPLVPESTDNRLTLVPKFLRAVREEELFADGQGKQPKDERIDSGDDKQEYSVFPAPLILVCTHPRKLNRA